MRTFHAEPVSDESFLIGEGPIWDAAGAVVRWVDIPAAAVLSGRLDHGSITDVVSLVVPETTSVSAVALAAGGGLLVAGARGLVTIDGDGQTHTGPGFLNTRPESRLNDGQADPQGRLVVGSMADRSLAGRERLFRIEPDGSMVTLRTGLTCSNGIGWSPDGGTLYHVDSADAELRAFRYDAETQQLEDGDLLVSGQQGPDGLAVDADGYLWVAFWGAGEVRRFTPTGEQVGRVLLPVARPTSVAFVGTDLDVLLITTAAIGLTREELAAAPDSGRLFACDVGTRGLPPRLWAGSSARPPWGTGQRVNDREGAQ